MNKNLILLYAGLIAISPALTAAEPERYPEKERIRLADDTRIALDRSGARITQHQHSDGSILAQHHGSMGHVTVARIGADGRLEKYCADSHDAALAWLSGEDPVRSVSHELSLEPLE